MDPIIKRATVYAGEALLMRWGESSANGRTVTLQLDEHGDNPFKGLSTGKNGQRVMVAVTLIGADEEPQPVEEAKREKSPADKAIAKAHVLAGDYEFQSWIYGGREPIPTAPEAALSQIRSLCNVMSTTEFRTNPAALKRFNDLVWEYEHRDMVR